MAQQDPEWRRQYLKLPDPLAEVPARFLSAEGFAERVLRLIATEQKRRPPQDVLALIQQRCEQLVWGGE